MEQYNNKKLGFDQLSNFLSLLKSFENTNWGNRKINIYFWQHPKEKLLPWVNIISKINHRYYEENLTIKIIHDKLKRQNLFRKLNLVCSYYSTVLYDALYFGIPGISIGIGAKVDISNALITNKLNLTKVIVTEEDLMTFIDERNFIQLSKNHLQKTSNLVSERKFFSDGFATQRVIDIILNNLK